MFRWLAVCLLLAAGTYALMAFLVGKFPTATAVPGFTSQANAEERNTEEPSARETNNVPDKPLQVVDVVKNQVGGIRTRAVVVPEARVQPTDKQEVPSERNGKLIFIGTDIQPGEQVPPEKRIKATLAFLAIEADDTTPENETFTLFTGSKKKYRRWKEGDPLKPRKVVLAREEKDLRKLEVGEEVKEGQLLALVNPTIALNDLASKATKLEGAEADRRAAEAAKEETYVRWQRRVGMRRTAVAAASEEEVGEAKLAFETKKEEANTKAEKVREAQEELAAAMKTLRMYEIRSSIPGVVKVIYKNKGDAVKELDAVLQVQNPNLLRVEGFAEIQDARKLKRGMEVALEISQPQPPVAVLRGHLQDVTCVAVSKGPNPKVVSGSEDQTLRIWEHLPREDRWQERYKIDHHAVVRAVACTPQTASNNLILSATSTGVARLFNLDNLKEAPRILKGGHHAAINCAAFSPDGKLCVTGGEDYAICLWNTETGELVHRMTAAHRAGITTVQFATPTYLISAGRDNQLLGWTIEPGKAPIRTTQFDRRSGDVAQLSASPDGKQVLFDQGKELRVLSLASKRIEGLLQNTVAGTNFTTLALFAPDGKTILTNGSAPGQLQLWRAPSNEDRAAQLRQFIWSKGMVSCGAFAPDASFAVTGTARDHQVLVWAMPKKAEIENRLTARLSYVEQFLDTSVGKVVIQAELNNPGWIIPGGTATMVIPYK